MTIAVLWPFKVNFHFISFEACDPGYFGNGKECEGRKGVMVAFKTLSYVRSLRDHG